MSCCGGKNNTVNPDEDEAEPIEIDTKVKTQQPLAIKQY